MLSNLNLFIDGKDIVRIKNLEKKYEENGKNCFKTIIEEFSLFQTGMSLCVKLVNSLFTSFF